MADNRLAKNTGSYTEEELANNAALLTAIAELGGKGRKEEDIVFSGQKVNLPERFRGNLDGAIEFLDEKRREEEETSEFKRVYNFRPWDGALNAFRAMKKAFGFVTGKPIYTMFGKNPPEYIQVPISVDQTEEVPWGRFQVPLLERTDIYFQGKNDKEFGQVFQIVINSPRKNRFIIEGLFKLIEDELKTGSIYRGKQIDGQEQPEFLDLSGFDPEKVVYSEQVQTDLEAHVWSVLRHAQANRDLGLKLKRSVLFTGVYGTGKSLAGWRTALESREAGWTFIMARPGRDDFKKVMQTARIYQPAVVFMEDVDTLAAADNEDQISLLLDLFDGIQAKNTEIVVVMTTNHPDSLHRGMMRPGRLDAIIEIGELDAAGIEKLFRQNIKPELLDKNVDFVPVIEAAKGFLPAFIKEAADRALRYALARNNGVLKGHKITTEDLVHAAGGLRPQFDRMNAAPEHANQDPMSKIFGQLVMKSTQIAVADIAADKDYIDTEVWNEDKITEVRENAQMLLGNGNGAGKGKQR